LSLERCQSKVLQAIVNAPWYTSNIVLRTDIKVPKIREEIEKFGNKITTHPNELPSTLLEEEPRRLNQQI
jgi:hypothetical protein